MPAGKTHDRITLYAALPLSALAGTVAMWLNNPVVTVLAIAGHLFSGFMFGPDLDCRSDPYYRWRWLRYIWIPYRNLIPRHRSVLSHGFAIGTTLRVAYLFTIVAMITMGYFVIASAWATRSDLNLVSKAQDWQTLLQVLEFVAGNAIAAWLKWLTWIKDGLVAHPVEAIALWVGLEIGAMSHYLADAIVSGWNRGLKKKK